MRTTADILFLVMLFVAPVAAGLGGWAKVRGDRSAFVVAWIAAVGALTTAAALHFWPPA